MQIVPVCPISVSYNASHLDRGVSIDLSVDILAHTISITGTKFDDVIVGNDQSNVIDGQSGNDVITGGEATDIYVVTNDGGQKRIDNFAKDGQLDYVLLKKVKFDEVGLDLDGADLVLTVNSSKGAVKTTTDTVVGWGKGPQHQHIEFRTSDGFTFTPRDEAKSGGKTEKFPTQLDASKYKTSLELSQSASTEQACLQKRDSCPAATLAQPLANHTEERPWSCGEGGPQFSSQNLSAIEGPTADGTCSVLEGNAKANALGGGPGGGRFFGGDGADLYRVNSFENDSATVFINNRASDGALDTVHMDADYKSLKVERSGADLSLEGRRGTRNHSSAVVMRYFEGEQYQHLLVKAADGETFQIRNDSSPVKHLKLAIDKAGMTGQQRVNAKDRPEYDGFRKVVGARRAPNHVSGYDTPLSVEGGDETDVLEGGDSDDILKGAGEREAPSHG